MMKKALVWAVVSIVVVFIGVYSFADDKEQYGFYVPSRNEELYGTWVNESYRGSTMDWPQKVVVYDWGYIEYFDKVTDKDPCLSGWAGWPCKATFTIVDKWTDSEGNIWYKLYTQQPKLQRWFEIDKISKNGTVWESKSSSMFWYKELDINKAVYYRQ